MIEKPASGGGSKISGTPPAESGIRFPWCLQCNKPVDSVGYEHDSEPIWDDWGRMIGHIHIRTWLIIECHGETYRVANDRPAPPMPIRIGADT